MAGPVVLNIKAATFKLASTQAGLTTGQAFSCQITNATVSAQPKLVTVPATMCAGESQSAAGSGFQLDISFLQDWNQVAPASLSRYLYDNDGKQVAFEITPTDPVMPKVTGDCWAVAGDYGGDMGSTLVATATLPCLAKPTIAAASLFEAGTEGVEGQPVEGQPEQATQPGQPVQPDQGLQTAGVA